MADRRQILVIDLLRIAAAGGVLLHHLVAMASASPDSPVTWFSSTRHLPAGGAWATPGWVGVEIFFVISGYVIARSTAGVGARAFLTRRALRLVPAAWICASLTALVLLIWSSFPPSSVVTLWSWAMLFLPRGQTIDPSYWTLEIEVAYYLLVAVALWRAGAKGADRVTTGLGVVSAVFLLAISLTGPDPAELYRLQMRLMLLPHGVFFALGALLATAHARGFSARAAMAGMLFVAGATAEIVIHTHDIATHAPDAPGAWVPVLLFAIAVAAIAAADRLQNVLIRCIGAGRLMRLSSATYPLYLLHQVIGSALIVAALALGFPAGSATLLAIGTIVVMAIAVSRWVEPAVRRSVRDVFSPRNGPAPDTRRTASLPGG